MLYLLIIMPIYLLIETVFILIYRASGDAGFSIIMVSLAVNILVLPLYLRADTVQKQERERQQRMEPYIRHIKKAFHGNEQYMMLSTYYRQNNYSPLHALRGTFSLLLQVPFFIAAYRFLSGLSLLSGASYFMISDLAVPDRLLSFGAAQINLLPVLMTLLNVVSTVVYTKGAPLKEKLQAYGLAVLFLVLLYNSPSGLVLYWTCNQIFSIVKNVVMTFVRFPARGSGTDTVRQPAALHRFSTPLFLTGALCLTLLTGALIPSAVIADSPLEFVSPGSSFHPVQYITGACCIAAGCFLLWGGIVYILSSAQMKNRLSVLFASLGAVFLAHYFVFSKSHGVLSSELTYEETPVYAAPPVLLSILLCIALAVLCLFLSKKTAKIPASVLGVTAIALFIMSLVNVHAIRREVSQSAVTATGVTDEQGNLAPILRFSKNGRNVIVVMLDRAISGYIPYIMQEKPELAEQFDGFTYYPNTISHGAYTVFGVPALYGGYDYTVAEMNLRDSEPLVTKHNEALRVMPAMFTEEGFDVTVCDPPFANYKWIPDLSIYRDLPGLRAYNTDGVYKETIASSYESIRTGQLVRNFFCYGLFRSTPLFARPFFYDEGLYHAADDSSGIPEKFLNAYSVLVNLIPLSETTDGASDTFLLCQNCTTHEPVLLQTPAYEPVPRIERNGFYEARLTLPDGSFMRTETEWQLSHYHVNMAALLRLGEWFDWMRAEGIYDNTRIIVVSDHGRFLKQFDNLLVDEELDVESVNALLMVKDFDASAALATDRTFMTTADVPALATKEILSATKNPFTGNPLAGTAIKKEGQLVTTSDHWRTTAHPWNTFDTSDGHWYTVHDNIFDQKNWTRVE